MADPIRKSPLLRRPAAATGFARDEAGLAAVEFALLLPVMTLLFFGMLEASDLLTVKRRITTATNSLVDLASKEPAITKSELDDLMVGVMRIIEPSDTSTVTMKVVSLTRGTGPSDPVVVHWSRDEDGAEPYTVGANYTKLKDDASLRPGNALLIAEVGYHYERSYAGRVIKMPFDFASQAVRWPRKSARVNLCASADLATCTS
jgi:Flp pilus assembly protein TadG